MFLDEESSFTSDAAEEDTGLAQRMLDFSDFDDRRVFAIFHQSPDATSQEAARVILQQRGYKNLGRKASFPQTNPNVQAPPIPRDPRLAERLARFVDLSRKRQEGAGSTDSGKR
jgi:hypothetical protein